MTADPKISVVVATRNRQYLLPRLADALRAQSDIDGDVEVIFVDDGSTDDTPQRLASLPSKPGVRMAHVRSDVQIGPAAARNLGWRLARAPYVAFTDDDCLPTRRWLAELLRYAQPDRVVQGQTLPNPEEMGDRTAFSRTVHVPDMSGHFETCNVLYPRSALEEAGGFDEEYPLAYGEDLDLGHRVVKQGLRPVFAPDALVYHKVWNWTFGQWLADAARHDGFALAVKKNPDLRARLHLGLFERPSHAPAAVVLAAPLFAMSRSRMGTAAALATALPYAYHRTRTSPLAGAKVSWTYAIPARLVVELAEIAVLAKASIKHRTLVL